MCRREGEKLFLKGERCYSAKCAVERRESAPGQHGKARGAKSDFKAQLREKQKVKRIYGMLERPFRLVFERAANKTGVTGTELLVSLERRLDNVVYRLGFGSSRKQSRQLVRHGHVVVNGKLVDIPSFLVSVGDTVEIDERAKKNIQIAGSMEAATGRMIPEWLSLEKGDVRGSVKAMPTREQLPPTLREQLIVELYSK
jgi:small subunit ribosomal protein S4